jgi:N-methylhydantoinase B/oxoprolinase/acetone carboxylase alpha subunit
MNTKTTATAKTTRTFETRETIGWSGRTLREMLEANEEAFARTGRYAAVDKLELKETDPILYEKIFSKLRGALVTARSTAMNISASPIVKEIGELCFSLYSPEGDSVALSTGIIVHVHTMSDAIKFMIRNDFEDNPGIADGDIFINNDPHIGDVHNADVQTLVPIFHEGEIIGWAGGVTHEIDIGALTPGSVPVGPTTRFEDGIDVPVLKCGARDRLFRDHELRCAKATRTPTFWKLDEKARIAGNHIIRRAVLELVDEIGIDTYKQVIREIIEEGRRSFLQRMRELTVPGRYRCTAFSTYCFSGEDRLPAHARVDHMAHMPMEMTIDADGTLGISMEGADRWGFHSMNCTPSGMQGAVWVVLSQLVVPNDKVNDGAYYGTRHHFPLGSWANPGDPSVSTGIAWLFLVPAFTSLVKHLSRAFQARGYLEDVISAYGVTGNVFQGGGLDQYGGQSATTNFEFGCAGTGAGFCRDGLDFAAAVWNPEGDMGEIEIWECIEPFIYLGRRVKPNTAGAGKYRGGAGLESLKMTWNTPHYELQNINSGKAFENSGLWGGYPNATGYRKNLKRTNMNEVVAARAPYPVRDGDTADSEIDRCLSAEVVQYDDHTVTLPHDFQQGDLYLSVQNGGKGLGDPLEREPELVAADVRGGFLSARFARTTYGVILSEKDGQVAADLEATAAERRAMREARRTNAKPVAEWRREQRERVLAKDVVEPVRRMYRSAMELSEAFAAEFRAFHELPDDFTF